MGRQQGHSGRPAIERVADGAKGEFFAITAEIHSQPLDQAVGVSNSDLCQNIDLVTCFHPQLLRRQDGNVQLLDSG